MGSEQSDELVTVRIALAIDHTGKWFAGGSYRQSDDDVFEFLVDDLQDNEARYFITAKVRKPAMAIEVNAVDAIEVAAAQQKEQ